MKYLRIIVIVLTALISIMSIPFAFSDDVLPADWSESVGWVFTIIGVLGLVAAFGLFRKASWGLPAVLAIAVAQVVGGIAAMSGEMEGAAFGLSISLALLATAGAHAFMGRANGAA